MYVPSDFFRISLKWIETIPQQKTMEFSKNAQFYILSKEVDRLNDYPDDLEPPDADYLFCAKVRFHNFFFFFSFKNLKYLSKKFFSCRSCF